MAGKRIWKGRLLSQLYLAAQLPPIKRTLSLTARALRFFTAIFLLIVSKNWDSTVAIPLCYRRHVLKWKHLPNGIQFDSFTRRFGNFWYQGQMADLHTSPAKLKNASTHGIIRQFYHFAAVVAPDATAKEKRESNCTANCSY